MTVSFERTSRGKRSGGDGRDDEKRGCGGDGDALAQLAREERRDENGRDEQDPGAEGRDVVHDG